MITDGASPPTGSASYELRDDLHRRNLHLSILLEMLHIRPSVAPFPFPRALQRNVLCQQRLLLKVLAFLLCSPRNQDQAWCNSVMSFCSARYRVKNGYD